MKTLTLVLILLTTLVSAAGAQVMSNPSFEQWLPDTDLTIDRVWAIHPDTTYQGYHNPNVNFSGNGWVVGWYTSAYGLDYCTSNLWKASNGTRFLRFRNNYIYGDGLYSGLSTVPGKTYVLKYDMAGDLEYLPEVKSMKVVLVSTGLDITEYPTWDGTGKVGTGLPYGTDPGWETHEIVFTATASATYLALSNNTIDDDPTHANGGALCDNIRFSEFVPPTEADIPTAKGMVDGSSVMLRAKVVTATNSHLGGITFSVQEPERTSGICLDAWEIVGGPISVGDSVDVSGDLRIVSGEALLRNAQMTKLGSTTPASPLGIINKSLGGSDLNSLVKGATGGTGVNNVGLLVKVFGSVKSKSVATQEFTITDGSGVPIRVSAAGTTLPDMQVDDYISVVGICRLDLVGSDYVPYVALRDGFSSWPIL